MSMRLTICLLGLSFVTTVGCTDSKTEDDTGETGDTDPGDDVTAENGLPEGDSVWTGNGEVGGFNFLLSIELTNTGGDLEAVATIQDDPEGPLGIGTGIYTMTGTHDPVSGLLALAPLAWTQESDLNLELLGFSGTYDPSADTISGMIQDYASGADNTLVGGPASLGRSSGDGEPTTAGDRSAGLSTGDHTITGTSQCTSSVRDIEASLNFDGEGAVSGDLTLGDTGLDTPLGTFAFTGVYNPATGGITIVPGLWVDPDHTTLTFFIDGTYEASSGAFTGDMRTNTNACPSGTWNTTIE